MTCKKARRQNERDTARAQMGMPLFVQYDSILGAWPVMDIPCRVRVAVNRRPFPALKMDVMISAFTM